MRKILIIFCIFMVSLSLAKNDVKTIQYRSSKTTKYAGDTVNIETMVFLANRNMKLEYLTPEKRTVMLVGDDVFIIDVDNNVQKVKYQEMPAIMHEILRPSIFNASYFLENLSKGYKISKQNKTGKLGLLYSAVPEKPVNIARIEYEYDPQTDKLFSYRIIGVDGGLISEVRFFDYKVYNNKYLLPTRIQTLITGKEGLIEENEKFERIKVDAPIDKLTFKI